MKYPHPHRPTNTPQGFTLAELIVASTILTVVMAAVYTAFGSTLRTWRQGEAHLHTYQDARTAINVIAHELECILGGSEHLFQGEDDEFEFFAVTAPMDVADGEGARVLWIRYYYDRSNDRLVRQEAPLKKPLPLAPPPGEEASENAGRVSLGRKSRFYLAKNVLDLEITYYWVPPPVGEPDPLEPPVWVYPIEKEESREGWGLPQGMRVAMTLEDPNAEAKKTVFTYRLTFHGPTTPYSEERIGRLEGLEGLL